MPISICQHKHDELQNPQALEGISHRKENDDGCPQQQNIYFEYNPSGIVLIALVEHFEFEQNKDEQAGHHNYELQDDHQGSQYLQKFADPSARVDAGGDVLVSVGVRLFCVADSLRAPVLETVELVNESVPNGQYPDGEHHECEEQHPVR